MAPKVARRVDEEREERHVEHDRLRIQEGDQRGLLEEAVRLHPEDRRVAGLGKDHADA
jgi:hypothetical protein